MSAKLTIEQMRDIATNKRGKCLSAEYFDALTKLEWECSEGHTWEAIPNSVINGSWCPKCGGSLKLTIEEMQDIAAKKGGKCLSKKYVNSKAKLEWRCSEGHTWEAIPKNVKRGAWCPYCAGRAKLTIEEMQDVAAKKGGKCLSTKYFDAHTKLEWECSEGHTWKAKPNSIKTGTWCAYCAGRAKLTMKKGKA
jgi:hypothetical protein